MMTAIGLANLSAPAPTRIKTRKISSVAYATDESGSDERTARPVTRESRSWWASWVGIRWPTTSRLKCEKTPSSGMGCASEEAALAPAKRQKPQHAARLWL